MGKAALVRAAEKSKYMTLENLNKSNARVSKNLGETNEAFGLENLKAAQVCTHDRNAEIPRLITEGKGSVMITEICEALRYSKADPRLYAAYIDAPLTPNYQQVRRPPSDKTSLA